MVQSDSLRPRWPPRLTVLAAAGLVALAIHGFWTLYAHYGLFRKLGADFVLYHTQAVALRTLGPGAMYDANASQVILESLLRESNPEATARFSSVPYPPLFGWLLTPFTYLSLSHSFALWTVLNLLAALYLGFRCASLVASNHRPLVILLVLAAYPVTLTVFLGQIQIWLACAVAEAYFALRQSHDMKAGLWLGLLIIKPQYLMLLVPLLLWKRRWHVLGGMAMSAAAIWLGSALAVGGDSLRAYPQAFGPMLGFHSDWPQAMINWRGLYLTIRPGSGERSGLLVTLLLGLATSLPALLVWRTGWHEDRSDFPAKLTLLFIATLLTVYQSHSYGASMLAVLMTALWVTPYASPLFRSVVVVGAFLPTIILCSNIPISMATYGLFARIPPAALLTTLSLIGSYLVLLNTLRRRADPLSGIPAVST
jgi:hypothetical protein